ncbi:hypothetical protein [Deinococcus fonticola]|uniref:hypothetical protein n=1 Tax=Deinococcus fonticola TaxID=2528713 RepID=UPI00197AC404|nr:hypothetical protein [Deinococcus fonticola]
MEQGSELELAFLAALRDAAIPEPERELMLVPGRKWRSDFAWPEARLIVEAEGGTWGQGRHTRGRGFEEDCRKYALLTLAGWRVIRITGAHVKSGEAVQWVKRALGLEQ